MTKTVSVKEVEYTVFRLAREWLTFNEPTPDLSSRFPNILESCLATPFKSFVKKSLYPTLISKAATLFYLLVFLYKNKRWIKADTQELLNFTIWIAQSPARYKEEAVRAIEKFLKDHIVKLAE
jgi:hypothetical protein